MFIQSSQLRSNVCILKISIKFKKLNKSFKKALANDPLALGDATVSSPYRKRMNLVDNSSQSIDKIKANIWEVEFPELFSIE